MSHLKGYMIKDGKVVARPKRLSVSAKIKQRKSKKQRPVSPAKAGRVA